jgi:hypothetical protein
MDRGEHTARLGGPGRGPTDTVLMPAEPRFLTLARTVVEVCLARSACDPGCLRDLQLATDELAAILIDAARRPSELLLAVTDDATDAYVRVAVPTPPGAARPQIDALTRLLLDATVDSYVIDADDGLLLGVLQRTLVRDESG